MAEQRMQALVTEVPKGGSPAMVKKSIPVPEPAPNQALVKISHIAQNPTDIQSLDSNAFGDDAVLGCDFVGTVERTGDKCSKLARGDTVAGLIWGGAVSSGSSRVTIEILTCCKGETKGIGGYSEYSLADDNISFRVPKNISLEEAATLPLASMTAWLALFSKGCLAIPRDSSSDTSVLIWGGSSSVGFYAIQIAAMQGLNVVTTCSPRHFERVKALGAKHAFDYRDSSVIESIKKAAPGLKYVFDTIGNTSSSGQASQAIDERGGRLCTVRPGKANTDDVTKQTTVTDVLVWTAFLKEHRYGDFKWPASEDDHKLGTEFYEKLPGWIEAGKFKPNTPKVIPGGLDGVEKGFQAYRDGAISGEKLVYKL
ncbi:zinc-binding oxidoreductase [Colletotrichum tofieldiae]|nr:zinc-binding oxidoreductase [Colletotrichum tofieldiae]GKT81210.1 zinc-binding oxidoreductase [Colletotrichum tofieldiae]